MRMDLYKVDMSFLLKEKRKNLYNLWGREALLFNQEIVYGELQENIMEKVFNMSKYLTEIPISSKTLI